MPERVYEADLTWTGEAFERGVRLAVAEDGRIASLDRAGAPGSPAVAGGVERLPGRALLPGFVDAHSHAFQRGLRGRGERFPGSAGSFWSWREAMYELVGTLDPERFRALCLQAFREMRSAGITTVGEFHYLHHAADVADYGLDELLLEAAAEAGIRLALLQAYYRWGAPGRPLEGPQRRFRSDSVAGFLAQLDRLGELLDPRLQSLGIAAHSLRAAAPDEVAELWAESERRDLPFHMHVEEQAREIAECEAAYGKRPMELLLDRLPLSNRFTAVHCTHTDRRDLERFAAAGATACLCPTTEASLGDGVPDLPALLAAGGRVCLGTDSNARISMIEEARWLELSQRLARERRGIARDAAGRVATTLLHAATRHGARALGVAAGELRPGAWADAVAIDLAHPELEGWTEATLLESIFLGAGDRVIAATCVGGRWLAAGTG